MESTCSCMVGKPGYCNHSLALMLEICKFSLFESVTPQNVIIAAKCNNNHRKM